MDSKKDTKERALCRFTWLCSFCWTFHFKIPPKLTPTYAFWSITNILPKSPSIDAVTLVVMVRPTSRTCDQYPSSGHRKFTCYLSHFRTSVSETHLQRSCCTDSRRQTFPRRYIRSMIGIICVQTSFTSPAHCHPACSSIISHITFLYWHLTIQFLGFFFVINLPDTALYSTWYFLRPCAQSRIANGTTIRFLRF